MKDAHRPRRAGQLPDELLPGENSNAPQTGDEATGSPAGGIASTGLAGMPDGDGRPGDAELNDVEDETEPQLKDPRQPYH
jgi:hypothetical protein